MSVPVIQTAVNAGEISPALYGRVDLAKYRSGCSTLRNMWASFRGGASSRAGTKFCGQSKQDGSDDPPVLIPFQYSVEQGYALEFGDEYMRVVANGAFVVEDAFNIGGATNADPGVFTAAGNDFEIDDWVYLADLGGMTEVNGGTYIVYDIPTTGSFSLRSTMTGENLDTTDFGAYTTGGTVARVFTLETPYAVADLPLLKWTQSADVMTLTHPDYPPYDLARIDVADYTLTETTFTASIAAPSTCTSTASTTTASNPTQYQYVVTAIDKLTGEESIASPITTITNSVNIATTLGSETITWPSVTGAAYYNIYKAPPSYGTVVPVGSLFGYAGTSLGLAFTDTNVISDLGITPPKHTDPFAPGAIDYFVITATGSSYSTALLPTVYISDPTGSGAIGTAVVGTDGGVHAIIGGGGRNYSNPSVAISFGGTGSGATFTANGSGFFNLWLGGTNQTVNTTGSGYVNPVVTATYPSPSGGGTATLVATTVTVSGGHITGVVFPVLPNHVADAPNATTVTITAVDSIGTGATATAHVGPTAGTYPSCAAYFQDRRFYANTANNPDTYFASQPGAFKNMDSSIPVTDGDAIVGTPWAQQVNGIQFMVPMPGGLVILTGLGAWQLSGGSNGAPVTPSNQVATAQAYNGCSPTVRPITINYDILYVQSQGSIVRDLSYNFFVNIYTGADLTMLSNHLFDGHSITRWDWAEEPYRLVWAVRDDGILLCLTYVKDQDVYAWSRHDTNGLFQSVCCVSEPPVNAPYFVVKRLIQNNGDPVWVYYIERMDNRLWSTIDDCWCVDCGVSLPQDEPDATLTAASATGEQNIGRYNLISGGSGYTAPVGTITDLARDGGSGASVTFTVAGGVITAAVPDDEGAGYIQPQLTISDPTGSGAIINPIITNYVEFSASGTDSPFTSGSVGDVIIMGGGRATIVEYTDADTVTANITQPITQTVPNDPNNTPVPAQPGTWTLATPTASVSGLSYLEGMDVVALADGGVVRDLTVTDGAVTLPQAASSVLVGLPFTAQMQTLYLETGQQPTIQTKRKNIYQVGVRVENSRPPEIGVNQPDQSTTPNGATLPWTGMSLINPRNPNALAGSPIPLYSGDYIPDNVFGEWNTNGQVAIQQTDPVPLTVLAVTPQVEIGDSSG